MKWFRSTGIMRTCSRTDIESNDLKLVARALLPAEILEGSKLKYELMQYELIG